MKQQKTKLTCACGATADLLDSIKAWNGWQVAPKGQETCPKCIAAGLKEKGFQLIESHVAGKIIRVLKMDQPQS